MASSVACLLLLVACLFLPTSGLKANSLRCSLASFSVLGAVEEAEEGRKHEALFRWINFLLLFGGLAYLLRKPLAEFFAQRSAAVQKSLEEGQKALEVSHARLAAVEERLRHLEEEIAAFRASARREMEAERDRLRQAVEEEAEKIMESARAQLSAATRSARLELRAYTVQQALGLAEGILRGKLDDTSRGRLVNDFVARVQARAGHS